MSEHTEGKIEAYTEESFSGWFALRQITDDGLNHEIGSGDGGLFEPDARRLAAAWNAFDGVRTEFIEAMAGTGAMRAASDSMSSLPAALSELNAARALLREVVNEHHQAYSNDDLDAAMLPLTAKIRTYLDACDKPGEQDAS